MGATTADEPVIHNRLALRATKKTFLIKESLIKSNYFKLVKTADIFPEDRRNSATITTHFEENCDRFSGA
jgi:hypothetical protein